MDNISYKNLFSKSSLFFLMKLYLPAILFIVILKIGGTIMGVSFDNFSRDPIQILDGGKIYTGVMSQVGVAMWCATAAILLFSSYVSSFRKAPGQQIFFLFWAGLLTAFMFMDDLFLFHDVVVPRYLGLSEKFFYGFYGLSVVAIFYIYRSLIIKTDYMLFLFAFIFLGGSVITDFVMDLGINIPDPFVVEDGSKFIGIVSWTVYFIRTSNRLLTADMTGAIP